MADLKRRRGVKRRRRRRDAMAQRRDEVGAEVLQGADGGGDQHGPLCLGVKSDLRKRVGGERERKKIGRDGRGVCVGGG